jgi:excisionase family DNA binding protein
MKPVPVFVGNPPIREVQAKAGASPAPLLTIDQAAELCSCSRRTIQTEMQRGHLRHVRIAKRMTRIAPIDLEEYLNSRKRGGTRPVDAQARDEIGGTP